MATRTIKWQTAVMPRMLVSPDPDAFEAAYTVREEMVACEIVHSDEHGDTVLRPDGKLMVLPPRLEGPSI